MLNYKIQGSGDVLLLIHGFGISFIIWEDLLPKLVNNYTVIMIELPGIGLSHYLLNSEVNYYENAASEVQTLLQFLGVMKFSVIAYSLGANVLSKYALHNKNLLNKVILLYPASFGKSRRLLLVGLQKLDESFPSFINFIISGFSLYILIFKLGFNYKYEKKIRIWHDVISLNNINVLKKSIFDLLQFDELDYRDLFNETLIVWGKHDLLVNRFKTKYKVYLANGGHSGPVSHADSIIHVIHDFLKG